MLVDGVRTSEAGVFRRGDVRLTSPRHGGRAHCSCGTVDGEGGRGGI